MAEDTPVGHTLLTISAADADDPNSGSSLIEFHISAGNEDGAFTVESDGKGVGHVVVSKVRNPSPRHTLRWFHAALLAEGPTDLLCFSV